MEGLGARRGVVALLLACLAWLGTVRAADPTPLTPERLVYLLEYIGTDYADAVQGGVVVNQFEFDEVRALGQQLVDGYTARRSRTDAVAASLRELVQSIDRRAPADEVWSATRRLLPVLAKAVGANPRPSTIPNMANGRRLWESDCASCHGGTGAADGPSAAGMNPPPAAFRGAYGARLSPRQIYNALTFGVSGTAMPSFAAGYTEGQRWDVAFFMMTLRPDFNPERPPGVVTAPFTLDELAASSSGRHRPGGRLLPTELHQRQRRGDALRRGGPCHRSWLGNCVAAPKCVFRDCRAGPAPCGRRVGVRARSRVEC
jgi:mono/diheme cytochrome c family protein